MAAALLACGCRDDGILLELALPAAPQQTERLEIVLDKQHGRLAERRIAGVYRIPFERHGDKYVARLKSKSILRGWHRYAIVTPDQRYEWHTDFRVDDSGWKMAKVSEKLAHGGVRSESIDEGSVYWMEIEWIGPANTESR